MSSSLTSPSMIWLLPTWGGFVVCQVVLELHFLEFPLLHISGVYRAQEKVGRRFGGKKWNMQKGSAGPQGLVQSSLLTWGSGQPALPPSPPYCAWLASSPGPGECLAPGWRAPFLLYPPASLRKEFWRSDPFRIPSSHLSSSTICPVGFRSQHQTTAYRHCEGQIPVISLSCSVSLIEPWPNALSLQIHLVLMSLVPTACQLPWPSVRLLVCCSLKHVTLLPTPETWCVLVLLPGCDTSESPSDRLPFILQITDLLFFSWY